MSVAGRFGSDFRSYAVMSSLHRASRWLVLGCGFLVVACQTASTPEPLSLEEAKRVTTTFVGPRIAPPRTVEDILALLDQPTVARSGSGPPREVADASPPGAASPGELAVFYLERAKAAHAMGRVPQDVEDARLASAYARRAVVAQDLSREIEYNVAWAEYRSGNYRRSIEIMTEVAKAGDGWAVSMYAGLARMHAWAGDLTSAQAAVREAASLADRGLGRPWGPVNVTGAQATIFGAGGQYREEERYLRQVVDRLRNPDPGYASQRERERLQLVESLVRQDRLVEAEAEARDVLGVALSKTGKYSDLTAGAVRTVSYTLFQQGRFAEAERLVRVVIEIYDRMRVERTSPQVWRAQWGLGVVLAAQERWSEAIAQFDRTRDENRLEYERFTAGALDFPVALIMTGRPADALPLLRLTIARRTERLGAQHYGTAEARGVLAMGLAATNDPEGALQEFEAALPVLLRRAQPTAQEGDVRPARLWRLGLIVETYLDLLARLRGSSLERQMHLDITAKTFQVADAARSQAVGRGLGASAARAAARAPAVADLVRRDQDAEQQIQALYGTLGTMLSMAPDQQDPVVVQRMRAQLAQLTTAREVLAREIERSFPEYAALMAPQPVTLEEARALLEPGEALVAFYVGHDRTFVWALSKTGAATFAVVPLSRASVGKMVEAVRRSIVPGGPTLGDVPDFDVEMAHSLYATLLGPVAAGWQGAQSLVVVPHGPLGAIPFGLLVTGPVKLGPEGGLLFARYREVPWLARRVALTHVPSAQALKALRTQPPGRAERRTFAGFGDPWFSEAQAREASKPAPAGALVLGGPMDRAPGVPIRLRAAPRLEGVASADLARLPRLPDTADEVRSIAAALGADDTRDVFLGARANEDTVKRIPLRDYRVVVFATHGLLPGDLDGLLQPALALSAPAVAGVVGDGLLTMEEILALELDADWVVLSACNTAAGSGAGAEALSGLGRAFFYAGARSLLVSHWPVEVTSSKELTTTLFRLSAKAPRLSRAEVLRQSMLTLVDGPGFIDASSGLAVFSYAHPLFWAPFALIGDGRGDDRSRP